MEETQRKERLWTRDYIIIILACFGSGVCSNIFFTALPLYTEKITGRNVFSGVMMAAYAGAALLSRPISGLMADKFGRVRQLIVSAFICAVVCALYGLTTSIILLAVIRFVNGFAFGMHTTCGGAAAADVIPKSRFSEGIGYYSLYGTVATAIAPGIALGILGDNPELKDYKVLFFVAAGVFLMTMIFDCMITYERKRKKEGASPDRQAVAQVTEASGPLPKAVLGFEYAVFLPVAVLTLLYFAISTVNTYLTLFAKDRSLGNIGLYYTLNAGGMFLSRILFGRVPDKRGTDIVLIPGIIGMALCLAAIPFVRSLTALCVIALPFGLSFGVVQPTINTMIFNRSSLQRRGSASAAYFAAIDIGLAGGGFAFGLVADALGFSVVYWLGAAVALAALLLYLKAVTFKKPREQAAS